MSGGLGTRLAPGANRATLASYIPTLGDFALDFHPGSHWSYGGALQVVARIIEVVSGMSYEEFMQTRVFDPLGMHDTHFKVPSSKLPRRMVIRGVDMSKWTARRPPAACGARPGTTSASSRCWRMAVNLRSPRAQPRCRCDDGQQPRGRPVRRRLEGDEGDGLRLYRFGGSRPGGGG